MRGSYAKHYERTSANEQATKAHKDACEQRLAKAMNTPKEKVNTPWEKEGGKDVNGCDV